MFFAILKAALWGAPLERTIADPAEWDALADSFERHAMLGIVADVMARQPAAARAEAQQRLLCHVAALMRTHQRLATITANLFATYEQAGFHPLLLKGDGLAALYPTQCLRACGDIDIYIGPADFDRSVSLLNTLIATEQQRANSSETNAANSDETWLREGYEYGAIYRGMAVELHCRAGWAGNRARKKAFRRLATQWLTPDRCTALYLDTQRGTASCDPTDNAYRLPQPAAQFNVLYVFNHICQHLSNGGLGLRQFCDWALLLHHYHSQLDLTQLRKDLRRCGLLRAWQRLGGIAVEQIGLPRTEFPFYSQRRARRSQGALLDDLLCGENFRTGQRNHRKLPRGLRRAWHGLLNLQTIVRSAAIISWATAAAAFVENFNKRLRGTLRSIFSKK